MEMTASEQTKPNIRPQKHSSCKLFTGFINQNSSEEVRSSSLWRFPFLLLIVVSIFGCIDFDPVATPPDTDTWSTDVLEGPIDVLVEDFETGNVYDDQPYDWVTEISPSYNYFPFYCRDTNEPSFGTAPHEGNWYMLMDNNYSDDPDSNRAEGWMFRTISLDSNASYTISLWALTDVPSSQYEVDIWIGTGSHSSLMVTEIISSVTPGIQMHIETTTVFQVSISGIHFIGIHGLQYGDSSVSKGFCIDDISITKN